MKQLCSIHDKEGAHILPPGGWCVDAVALSETAVPPNYSALRSDINWIVRLNWGWSPRGTLPHPAEYPRFASLCARFVSQCPAAVSHFIIANEPNHSIERPEEEPILAWNYADAFRQCYSAIKQVAPEAQVLTAAVAPWNIETGFWLDYFSTMLKSIPEAEGIALHTYSRGSAPEAITSEGKMGGAFGNYYNGFRSYRDFLRAVPPHLSTLPVYITETNQLAPWVNANSGWVQAAYREVATVPQIQCLTLYRWQHYDEYGLEGKEGVLEDFRAAVAIGGGRSGPPSVQWDSRLDARGVRLVPAKVSPGDPYWKLVKAQWFDPHEVRSVGPDHHILLDALDEQGKRVTGVSFVVTWPSGAMRVTTKGNSGYPWAADYPMSPSLNEFSVIAVDGAPSDGVSGLGMGMAGNPAEHTSTLLVFQRAVAPSSGPPPVALDLWDRCISFVLRQEGGLVDNPNDPGGLTNFGISQRAYPDLDIRSLTEDQAKAIYHRDYWLASGANTLPWPLCLAHFDLAVNGGVGRAQEALRASGSSFLSYMAWRISWYTQIPNFELFGRAWERRCADLLREAER